MLTLRKNIILSWLLFILSAGGTLFFLYGQGESAMTKKTDTEASAAPKPFIDSAVPARMETATFALG